jgi:hypothetical protein
MYVPHEVSLIPACVYKHVSVRKTFHKKSVLGLYIIAIPLIDEIQSAVA